MAVAIFPHRPSADELLDWHLSQGWQPTPSLLKAGPTILGHAACLVHRHADGK